MGRSSRKRGRGSRRKSPGHSKALEHIREARALSIELGGLDKDVKDYFFALSPNVLENILGKYEIQHGKRARRYAEQTFSKWKSRKIQMSGLVAERLFDLLPPIMPLEDKHKLAASLWRHVGPASTKTYYVGIGADVESACDTIKEHLEDVVVRYEIPSSMESRFDWLSHGDIAIKQQLLNHLRQGERLLLEETLRSQLPVLQSLISGERGEGRVAHAHATQKMNVGKHVVQVIVRRDLTGFYEDSPPPLRSLSQSSPSSAQKNGGCMLCMVGIVLALFWTLSN